LKESTYETNVEAVATQDEPCEVGVLPNSTLVLVSFKKLYARTAITIVIAVGKKSSFLKSTILALPSRLAEHSTDDTQNFGIRKNTTSSILHEQFAPATFIYLHKALRE
jgi:hypothetical protein